MIFKVGETVIVTGKTRDDSKTYSIRMIKKIDDRAFLYFLREKEVKALRLLCETDDYWLERVL